MRAPVLLSVLAMSLAACAAPRPAPQGLRDASAPIASIADVDWSRFSGDWRVTSSAGSAPAPGTPIRLALNAAGRGRWEIGGRAEALAPAGPGRLAGGGESYWLLWADADARTAVIGGPSGEFAWIMDRAAPSPDRSKAAREILDWYGYDLARFR